MAQEAIMVRSQMIILEGLRLVLPNTAIAEVIAYSELKVPKKAPEWFLGHTLWRGYNIPVISFESMVGQRGSKLNKRSRIIILNSITSDDARPFYGMLSVGIPRLMSLDESNIQDAPKIGETDALILRQVVIDKAAAVIPDQYELEARLKKHKIEVTASAEA